MTRVEANMIGLIPGLWICNRGKTWIWIHIKVKYRPKMEPWKAVDAHNGGVDVEDGALKVLKTSGHRFAIH
jgi:hypothetical protein